MKVSLVNDGPVTIIIDMQSSVSFLWFALFNDPLW
jgi:hypothetical protein